MWQRTALPIMMGTLFTVGIFYFMSSMVANSGKYLGDGSDQAPIEFLRTKRDDDLQTRKRRAPKKPEPKKPPKQPKLKIAQNDTPKPKMSMDMPISRSFKLSSGPFLGASGSAGAGEVVPLVRIEPQYPRKARMRAQEGWVDVQFDVTSAGTVTNVRILKSHPRRLFDSSARRAVLKWKYRPKVIDGKPVAQTGLTTRFDFKMENN